MKKTAIFFDPIEVTDRMTSLELTADLLSTAVRFGEAKRDGCTPNDPPILPSLLAWAGTTRKLRDDLPITVWRKSDSDLSLVVNGFKRIVICVAGGNENTGNPDAVPCSKRPVGMATRRAIDRNRQGVLDLKYTDPQQVPPSNCITHLLLRNRINEKIFWELSVPDELSVEGFVVGWSERIIFPPITLEPLPSPRSDDEDDSDQAVSVTRKVRKNG